MKYLIPAIALVALISAPTLAAERTGTLRSIEQSGTLKVGFRKDLPPMSFVDTKGAPSGYSIDLCKEVGAEVARTLGRNDLSIEFVPVTSENRFTSITDGKVDILCGATTKTLSRAKLIDFTQLTFVTGSALLSQAGAQIETMSQLEGKKVAVVKSTTTMEALTRSLKDTRTNAQIVTYESSVQGLKALLNGNVSAFAADQIVLIGLLRSQIDGAKSLYLSPELFSREPFALAVRRNDADFRLVADSALSRVYRSGRIEKIYNRWFSKLKAPVLLRALYDLNATPR